MKRVTDNQSTRFVLNVYRRQPTRNDNVRHVNCDTLQQMTLMLSRQMADATVHKIEVVTVLEIYVRD